MSTEGKGSNAMLTVQVSRWSQAAASLIPPQQEVIGWVHSRYARIVNVRTPSGRLLTVQGEGMLQAPLGLALATTPPIPTVPRDCVGGGGTA